MMRIVKRRELIFMSIFPFNQAFDYYDFPLKPKAIPETPKERLRLLFAVDENHLWNQEMHSVFTLTFFSALTGFILGGTKYSRHTASDFVRDNEATRFFSQRDAKKQLQHNVALRFFQGGTSLAWKLGLYTFFFTFTTTLVSTYRGKISPLDYTVGAGVAGFLYKFPMGPRAAAVGAGVGAILGLFSGGLVALITALTGLTMYHSQGWQYQLYHRKQREMQHTVDKYATQIEPQIQELYEQNLLRRQGEKNNGESSKKE